MKVPRRPMETDNFEMQIISTTMGVHGCLDTNLDVVHQDSHSRITSSPKFSHPPFSLKYSSLFGAPDRFSPMPRPTLLTASRRCDVTSAGHHPSALSFHEGVPLSRCRSSASPIRASISIPLTNCGLVGLPWLYSPVPFRPIQIFFLSTHWLSWQAPTCLPAAAEVAVKQIAHYTSAHLAYCFYWPASVQSSGFHSSSPPLWYHPES